MGGSEGVTVLEGGTGGLGEEVGSIALAQERRKLLLQRRLVEVMLGGL